MKLNLASILERVPAGRRSLLEEYESLLRARAVPLGLVAPGDQGRLMERHVLDSLRARSCLRRDDRHVVDIGSGAGLPGIPLAIAEPDRHIILLESRTKAVAFLELALESLRLPNAMVLKQRAEEAAVVADLAVARALAPPARAWSLTEPLLGPRGALVYFAGRTWRPHGRPDEPVVRTKICSPSEFPWQGPVVMMWRPATGKGERSRSAGR